MAKKDDEKQPVRKKAPTPLSEKQVKPMKRRAAKASTQGITAARDILLAAPGALKIDKKVMTKEKRVADRPIAPLVKKSGKARPVRVQLGISGAELGTHVFLPSIQGVRRHLSWALDQPSIYQNASAAYARSSPSPSHSR